MKHTFYSHLKDALFVFPHLPICHFDNIVLNGSNFSSTEQCRKDDAKMSS